MDPVVLLEHILHGREKPRDLPFELLKSITGNFSEDREIGQGGFATVYKGVLPNGVVAVKRIKSSHSINQTLFYRELDSLLAINHRNVVRFLGFCASTNEIVIPMEGSKGHIHAEVRERLLCLEHVSNGSLQKYITDELRGLEWDTRYRIVKGICEGLHHLHKEKEIYHMDLKPANILLDNQMIPKITDFGLARLDQESETMSENRLGSLGYCAPEYLHTGKMSFKSDIYSLGVIIIELVTGEKRIPNNNYMNVLRRWSHRWKRSGNGTPLVYQQLAQCIKIGLLCQENDPSKRPFIWDMIHDIREMEGVNGEISVANGQISPYYEDDMLGIEPLELHLPFVVNKQMSKSLQLTNQTGSYIAFYVLNMSPLPYCIEPYKGIVAPGSEYNVGITLQPRDRAPRDANEFIVLSAKVDSGLMAEEITIAIFNKDTGNVVDEVNLFVIFSPQIQPESGQFDQQLENINEVIPAPLKHLEVFEKNQDGSNANQITYNQLFLKEIKHNFSEVSELCRDAYGVIYMGVLQSGRSIAMRELTWTNLLDERTFQIAISYRTRIKHQNVVQFIGYPVELYGEWEEVPSRTLSSEEYMKGRSIVAETPKRLVCWEYLSNGSLDKYLYGETSEENVSSFVSIDWDTRFKLIKGICKGLHYLHKLDIPFIHMDLRPGNILLDANMVPKIADFVLSSVFGQEHTQLRAQTSGGSYPSSGYMAPEYISRGEISTQSDIYSLGLMILEITTGENNCLEKDQPSSRSFIDTVRKDWTMEHIASKYPSLYSYSLRQVAACIEVGLKCVEVDWRCRPPIDEIVDTLNGVRASQWANELQVIPDSLELLDIFQKNQYGLNEVSELCRDAYGVVYKGILQSGQSIAIRELTGTHHDRTFQITINYLTRIKHQNVLQFLGYPDQLGGGFTEPSGRSILAEIPKRLVCWEHVSNGSLDKYFYGDKAAKNVSSVVLSIDWDTCFKIINGICKGLHYLHKLDIPFIHMDLRLENILLDANMVPKIADFVLSGVFGQEQTGLRAQKIVGSYAYMAPEHISRGEISTQSDIYSLGVMILEITTREKNCLEKDQSSSRSFIEAVRKDWTQVHIASRYASLDSYGLQQVQACIEIGLKCVEVDRRCRPPIDEIIETLHGLRPRRLANEVSRASTSSTTIATFFGHKKK